MADTPKRQPARLGRLRMGDLSPEAALRGAMMVKPPAKSKPPIKRKRK